MMIAYLLLAVFACLVAIRQVMLLFFSETGRKHDLIKHVYKSGTDFEISIVVPYLDSRKIKSLQDLLTALAQQDYPANRVGIHVVATEDSAFGLPSPEELPQNTKIWTYPARNATRGDVIPWLIERLLAAGGPAKLFAFLDSDDIVRPDFLRNVTTRAFDCFALQGYVALKRPPKGLLAYVWALSTRLINRIENAGRFHAGLSARLLSSGWVVRQELLEMIPFKQGHDIDNLEYSILLNQNGYRINWAPNVVVYKDERIQFAGLMKDIVLTTLNRLRLTVQYALPLLVQGFTKLDFNLFEQAWATIKPANFVLGVMAFLALGVFIKQPIFPGSFYFWSVFALLFWSTQLLALTVARCSFKEVMLFLFATPLVYITGLVTFPVFLASALAELILQAGQGKKKTRVGKRFDESQPVRARLPLPQGSSFAIPDTLQNEEASFTQHKLQSGTGASKPKPLSNASDEFEHLYQNELKKQELYSDPEASFEAVAPATLASFDQFESESNTYPKTVILPISNGKNSVDAVITTYQDLDAAGQVSYYLVFEYKQLTFTSQQYRVLDQAFYELQARLQTKGFTILSCGSCGYFYRPANDTTPCEGYCLQGKAGQQLNRATDSVTTVTPICNAYTDIEQRPSLLKRWQASITQSVLL